MTRHKPISVATTAFCTFLVGASLALAAGKDPPDPNGGTGTRSVTTPLNGGNALAGAVADPNGGIGAQIGTGNSRRTPGTQQPGPDPFAQLVARLAQQACSAGRDTII